MSRATKSASTAKSNVSRARRRTQRAPIFFALTAVLTVFGTHMHRAAAKPVKLQLTVESDCYVVRSSKRLVFRTVLDTSYVHGVCRLEEKTCEVIEVSRRSIDSGSIYVARPNLREIRGRTYDIDGGPDGASYEVDLIRGRVTAYWTAYDPKMQPYTLHETGSCEARPDKP